MVSDSNDNPFIPLIAHGRHENSFSKLDAYFGAAGSLAYAGVSLFVNPFAEISAMSGGAYAAGQIASEYPSTVGWFIDNVSNMHQNIGIAIDVIDHGGLSPIDPFEGE